MKEVLGMKVYSVGTGLIRDGDWRNADESWDRSDDWGESWYDRP